MPFFFRDKSLKHELETFIVEDCLSLEAFQTINQGLKVFGCYALAAAVIPVLITPIIIPLSYLMIAAGAYALCFSLGNHDPQGQERRNLGLSLIALSFALEVSNLLLPFTLAAVLIWRAYPKLIEHFPVLEQAFPQCRAR